jgi:hypothetical protein
MRFETSRTRPDLRHAASHASLHAVDANCTDCRWLHQERAWRCPSGADGDVLISRWVDGRSFCRYERAVSPPDRHVIDVALKTTRLEFTRRQYAMFDGLMPAGTLHVTGPSKLLNTELSRPCDFVHLYVSSDYLRKHQKFLIPIAQPTHPGDRFVRDSSAESLARTLAESGNTRDELYTKIVGQILVMSIARLGLSQSRVSARPREFVNAYLDDVP